MTALKQLLAWLFLGGTVVVGWGMMKFTVPSKEDMLKKYPEDAELLEETRKNNATILKALEDIANNKEPFWKKK